MTLDIAHLRSWIGRTQVMADAATLVPLHALTAVLDRSDPPVGEGDVVPPLWHWLYFLPTHRQSEIGADGHPRLGGFLPPVPLPRRMWAGSHLAFHAPLRPGQNIVRTSRIANVDVKSGRTGSLVFVHVDHEIRSSSDELLIEERQDLVFREMPQAGDQVARGMPAPKDGEWSRTIVADEALLFRYSALTLNGHRIHYDRRHATDVEGYPGLVVHGPFIATLLMDLLRRERPRERVSRFTFRAIKPLFDGAPFEVCGRMDDASTAHLWARDADGDLAMEARVGLA